MEANEPKKDDPRRLMAERLSAAAAAPMATFAAWRRESYGPDAPEHIIDFCTDIDAMIEKKYRFGVFGVPRAHGTTTMALDLAQYVATHPGRLDAANAKVRVVCRTNADAVMLRAVADDGAWNHPDVPFSGPFSGLKGQRFALLIVHAIDDPEATEVEDMKLMDWLNKAMSTASLTVMIGQVLRVGSPMHVAQRDILPDKHVSIRSALVDDAGKPALDGVKALATTMYDGGALQEIRARIGDSAFRAEYQNDPAGHGFTPVHIEADDPGDWSRGALYALALACRCDAPEVAKEGLGAMGIRTIADLEARGADEFDMAPLRFVLWREGDKPAEPEAGAWLVAHDTGDGWYLHWTNEAGDDLGDIGWPFGESELTGTELERLGFEVV